jgi:NADH-quinone oxidoreductase subunit D
VRLNRESPRARLLDFIVDFTNPVFPLLSTSMRTLLTDNRIWKQRTVGTASCTPERRQGPWVTGPMPCVARASTGICRKKQPYEVYDRIAVRTFRWA